MSPRQQLRGVIKDYRKSLDKRQLSLHSLKAAEHLHHFLMSSSLSDSQPRPWAICLYVATGSEYDLSSLASHLDDHQSNHPPNPASKPKNAPPASPPYVHHDRHYYLPACISATEMIYRRVSREDLITQNFTAKDLWERDHAGIWTPRRSSSYPSHPTHHRDELHEDILKATIASDRVIIVAPALAVHKDYRTRLGWGGGYYDRYGAKFHKIMSGMSRQARSKANSRASSETKLRTSDAHAAISTPTSRPYIIAVVDHTWVFSEISEETEAGGRVRQSRPHPKDVRPVRPQLSDKSLNEGLKFETICRALTAEPWDALISAYLTPNGYHELIPLS